MHLKEEVQDVQNLMASNCEALLERDENLDQLLQASTSLLNSSKDFEKVSKTVKKKMFWKNCCCCCCCC
ncbi:vesicle-associated membrane protein 8-like isoform X3 [Styela clava]